MTDKWEPAPWEAKLPARARNVMQAMRREIEALRKAVDEVSVEDSTVTIDNEIGVHDEIGLGDGIRINFYPGEGRRTIDRIQVYLDQRNVLRIQADGEMHVLPTASNSCGIVVESRYQSRD